jgi:hypothetical protein
LQPHDPLTHAAPPSPVTQLVHVAPAAPHAVADAVDSQVVPLQQTPLHGWLALQVVVHWWVATSHA